MTTTATPERLQRIVQLFGGAPKELRIQALLEYSKKLPPLPPYLEEHRDELEQVPECQSPFFLKSEVDDNNIVTLHFLVPQEAPTTRGFAAILAEGLNGLKADEILSTPNDFYLKMGLAEAISSLRLRGIGAILARMKRQITEAVATRENQ